VTGAVLSQAFDRKLPIVETNSLRVLSRLFAYRADPRTGDGKKWVWSAAAAMVPARRAGDFNQALMELGALVCTPTDPDCTRCPVARWCEARRLGQQNTIPPRPRTKSVTEVREVAVAVRDRGRVLLVRRPPDADRWQNLWEVPHAPLEPGEDVDAAVIRVANDLTGLAVRPGPELATIRHGVTRWAITMTGLEARRVTGTYRSRFYTANRWVHPADLSDYPVSTPQRKLLQELTRSSRQRRLC
jgi:A/G-specific adenine glycosylase